MWCVSLAVVCVKMETETKMTVHACEGKDDDNKEENGHGDVLDGVQEAPLEWSNKSNTNLFHVLLKRHGVDGAMMVYKEVPYTENVGNMLVVLNFVNQANHLF